MTENTVDPAEKHGYPAVAAELRRIADDFEKLAGEPPPRYVGLAIQPYNGTAPDSKGGDEATIAAVDAVAAALIGKPAKTHHMLSGGSWHHTASGYRGQIDVAAYQSVSDPAGREREAELERLRAEVAALRAAKGASDG